MVETLRGECRIFRHVPEISEQLGQNEEPSVGPAASLDNEGTEIAGRGTIGQSLRVVKEPPSSRHQIDRRFRIFNHRAILNVATNHSMCGRLCDANVFQSGLPEECIRANPKCGAEVGEALMQEILNVGGRSGGSFEQARCVWNGTVGSLRDRESFIARLLHDLNETDGIVRQNETVRI